MSSGSTSRGNVRTLDEVIRREFRLAEGDAFNTALLRRSQQRLRNLGFFETVDVTTEQGSAPDKVVIKVKVTEKSTGELSFGAGFSTHGRRARRHPRSRERNLLGRGQDLSANFTVSQRRQQIDVSFTEPYFLDRDLAAGFDLFRTQHRLPERDRPTTRPAPGGTLRVGYPLTENLRHSVRYTLRDDEIQQRRQRRVGLHPGRGGRRAPPRWSARPSPTTGATTKLPAIGRLLSAARPGSGRPGRRQPLHPP